MALRPSAAVCSDLLFSFLPPDPVPWPSFPKFITWIHVHGLSLTGRL